MIYSIAGLFLIIGIGAILAGFKAMRRRKELLTWPESSARIVQKEVRQATRPGGGSPGFRKEAWMLFKVEDSGITSSEVFPSSPISDARTIEKWMDGFPDIVPVRRNPANPEDLVLLHGKGTLAYVIVFVGIIACSISVLVGLASFLPAP